MALQLGELSAVITADDRKFDKGLDASKSKFDRWGSKLGVAAAAVGAAAGVAIAAGIAGAMQLDKARTKLENQLGDEALAAELGDAAGDAYGRGFGDSAQTAMEAVRAASAGGLIPKGADEQTIEDLTVRTLALADTFGLDVTQAARSAGQMIRTGMADDGGEALDILTRGFQSTGDLSGDLLETVTEYGTKFRDLGLDGQQAMGIISQGMQAGARDTDKVADAIKEFSIRAVDGSDQTAEGFRALGLDAETMAAKIAAGGPEAAGAMDTVLDKLRDIEDPVKRDAAAVALFGTQAEDLGDALFALDPSEAVESLGEVEGAAEKMGDKAEESASQQLDSFKRSAKQAFVEQMAQALPTLKAVGSFLSEHKAIVGPLAGVLAGLAVVIGTIIAIYKVWIAVQTALNIVMAMNPLGLIIIAIVALIAGIVLLWQHSETFRDIVMAVFDALSSAVKLWWEGVKFYFGLLKKGFDLIVKAAKLWWKGVKKYFGFWKAVLMAVIGWVVDVKDSAVDTFNRVVDFVKGLPGRIKSAASGMWDGIKDSFRNAINWLIRQWNNFSLTLGGGSVLGLDVPSVTLSTPNIPLLAEGGTARRAGLAVVGEEGPELLHMRRGATVEPLDRVGGRSDVLPDLDVRVFIGDRELTDIVDVRVSEHDRRLRRRAGAGAGVG